MRAPILALLCAQAAAFSLPGFRGSGAPASARVGEIKAEILDLAAGTANGVRASDACRARVSDLVRELEGAAGLRGRGRVPSGEWELVYTDSQGNSAGKVGPFVGRVTQTFSGGDTLVNKVELLNGLFSVALTAKCTPLTRKKDKEGRNMLSVAFQEVNIRLGDRVVKTSEAGGVGSWAMQHEDDDLRVLITNQKSVFILAKRGD